ncbi:MAG: CBS domain-containing protein [Cryomorphaceae bacterium]|nr:CBS domain-containing protein [Flavobacteriales bacterium]
MVKSFQGVRKAPEKERQQVEVSDHMTVKLTTFSPTQSVGEVVRIMIAKRISGGPVLDDTGKLVGVISEGDCLKEMVRGKYSNSPNISGCVADHMVREVITIGPSVNVLDAADVFLNNKVRRLPVMKDGALLGQISQRDVMTAILTLKNETWGK